MPKVNARYVDTPSAGHQSGGEVPLKKSSRIEWEAHSEDAVNDRDYSSWLFRSRGVAPDYGYTFTESLILAQDERWRRA